MKCLSVFSFKLFLYFTEFKNIEMRISYVDIVCIIVFRKYTGMYVFGDLSRRISSKWKSL